MKTRLTQLADNLLLSRLDDLAVHERGITLRILDHMGEVERRELHLKQGYSSMFSYCTGRLGYSASAANRRIRTMRCVRRFPSVRALLDHNRVNLSTVSMVAGILTEANHARVLERIEGRSQRDVEAIAAEFNPRGAVRDSVRPVRVRGEAATGATRKATSSVNPTLMCEYDRSGRTAPADVPVAHRVTPEAAGPGAITVPGTGRRWDSSIPSSEPAAMTGAGSGQAVGADEPSTKLPDTPGEEPPEERFIIRFAAGPELVRQIEAARSLLSFKVPANARLEEVLGVVLGEFIERNDPARCVARRVARRTQRAKTSNGPHARSVAENSVAIAAVQTATKTATKIAAKTNPRAIPVAVRDAVFAEAGCSCEYVSPSGRRCGATMHLQVDHIVPVALGGTAARSNLRVLCARHNRLESVRLLGETAHTRGVPRARGATGQHA